MQQDIIIYSSLPEGSGSDPLSFHLPFTFIYRTFSQLRFLRQKNINLSS